MTYKDMVFDRIIELEKSLKKMKRSINIRGSSLTTDRYAVNYKTYILNIKIFNMYSEESYESQIEAPIKKYPHSVGVK